MTPTLTDMNPTGRFSDRVEAYARYRPGYPQQILDVLERDCDLSPASVIADIGSGTGLLGKVFLANGNTVFGVEPNPEMRAAGETLLQTFPTFHSVTGSAEQSTLPAGSVDFVTAGQAFHWFDSDKCKREFRRILTTKGWLVLVWNDRSLRATPFLTAYEKLLHVHGTDYDKVRHRTINENLVRPVFGNGNVSLHTFHNSQVLDYAGLEGRLLSCSYVPNRNQPGYEPMLRALREIFDLHQQGGEVRFEYETKMFYGQPQ